MYNSRIIWVPLTLHRLLEMKQGSFREKIPPSDHRHVPFMLLYFLDKDTGAYMGRNKSYENTSMAMDNENSLSKRRKFPISGSHGYDPVPLAAFGGMD